MTVGERESSATDGIEAFAALGAHQLGEAVALMAASARVLQERADSLGPEMAGALAGIAAGTERARRFVDDLLDLALVARDEPRVADVDLGNSLDAAREELADAFGEAGTRVRALGLPVVAMDPRLARRLLVHLLRMALSAGAREVRVRGRVGPAGSTLEVVDDGTPAEAGGTGLLEPWARPRGRGALVGAGLSLTICRRIAEVHDGRLSLGVRRDGRTSVVLTLPATA